MIWPQKLDWFSSRTEFCNSQSSVLLVSPECARGYNNECTHESFFPVVRTSQIIYRNNIPFLIVQLMTFAEALAAKKS